MKQSKATKRIESALSSAEALVKLRELMSLKAWYESRGWALDDQAESQVSDALSNALAAEAMAAPVATEAQAQAQPPTTPANTISVQVDEVVTLEAHLYPTGYVLLSLTQEGGIAPDGTQNPRHTVAYVAIEPRSICALQHAVECDHMGQSLDGLDTSKPEFDRTEFDLTFAAMNDAKDKAWALVRHCMRD